MVQMPRFPHPLNYPLVRRGRLFQSSLGLGLFTRFFGVLKHFRPQAATVRSVSISFSQEIIWFQLGMLWDAKFQFSLALSGK